MNRTTPRSRAAAVREWRISAQDGLAIAARSYGDPLAAGVPLLCLSGLSRHGGDFDHVARRHAPARRVVTVDYRGHGRSPRAGSPRDYAPEVLLGDVLQVMTALDLHAPVVLGTSLGGVLAMGLAVAAPTRLAGVVLNDIGPEQSDDVVSQIIDVVGRNWAVESWEAAVHALAAIYPNLGVRDAAALRHIAEATFVPGADGVLRPHWDPRIVIPLRRRPRRDLWPLYGALRHRPVLALRGSDSEVLSPATLERMRARKPDLVAVSGPGRGHAPMLNEPEAEGAIDDFLATLDG